MRFYTFVAALSVLLPISAQKVPSGDVQFPGVGQVSIHSVRVKGAAPSIDLLNESGEKILQVAPETGDFFKVGDVRDAMGPQIAYGTMHVAGLPDPLLLVVTVYYFADDCGYTPALVGAVDGKLRILTPELQRFTTRGGAFLKPASNGHPARLSIVVGHYVNGDTHIAGPSRVTVYRYVYDEQAKRFVPVRSSDIPTKQLKMDGENIISAIPALASC